VRVEGALAVGERLTVTIEKPNGKILTIHPHVLEFEPNRSLVLPRLGRRTGRDLPRRAPL
jgi:hypothetical protein